MVNIRVIQINREQTALVDYGLPDYRKLREFFWFLVIFHPQVDSMDCPKQAVCANMGEPNEHIWPERLKCVKQIWWSGTWDNRQLPKC
jgi:hypothetical protein